MRDPEMYVGYLPVPPGYRRFLTVAVPAALWVMVIAATFIARSQRSPGDAVWESEPLTLNGTVFAQPYPVLLPDDGGPVLLVGMGKHGAGERIATLKGRRVTVTGWPLHRDGRRILELEPGDAAIRADAAPPRPNPVAESRGRVTLRGEIVDSKCFLGAMKPGDGKTHKECATLCIRGIPPVLVVPREGGRREYYLLLNETGGSLDPASFPLIADPVELTGECESVSGMLQIRVRTADINRL